MPTLTRRRSHDSRREVLLVFYGDIPVGTIGERAGVPADLDQWGWTCGFYAGFKWTSGGGCPSGSANEFELCSDALVIVL